MQEISFQGTTAEDLHTIPVNDERSPKSLEVAAERPASQDVFSGELKTMDLETENAVGLPTNKDIQTALSERSSEFFHNVEVRHINKALHDLKIKDVVPDASRNQHRISVEAGKTNPLQLFKILGQKVFGDLHSNMQATDISSQESAYSGKDYSPLVAPLRQLNSLQTLAAHTSNAPSSTKPTGGDHIFGEMTSTHRRSFQSTKGQIGFEKPFHSPELSVVLEVDTPNSSYRTSRENCSIMTTFIEAEDAFSNVESDFGKVIYFHVYCTYLFNLSVLILSSVKPNFKTIRT